VLQKREATKVVTDKIEREVDAIGLTDGLTVKSVDQPGNGGAHHLYEVEGLQSDGVTRLFCGIAFQDGPVQETGLNGVSEEALLAIVRDRLQSFQSGPYNCRENACALTNLEQALFWMNERKRKRTVRGVEGTSQK
jgi:hypothetical protein